MQPHVLNADELNAIAKSSGYTGGPFSSVGLPTSPSPGSRNLNLTAGNDTGIIQQNQNQSNNLGATVGSNTNDINKFNESIMGLLSKYQSLGTKSFVNQGLDAKDAQINASTGALTDPSLRGYAPSTILSAGNSAATPYNPTIQSAGDSAQTFNEQLGSFGKAVDTVRSFVSDYEVQQEKQQVQAAGLVHDAIAGGSDALQGFLNDPNSAQVIKLAGYSPQTLQGTLKGLQKTEEAKKSFTTLDLGNQIGILDSQGNIVKFYPKGQNPGTVPNPSSTPSSPSSSGTVANDVQAILEGRNTMYNIRQTMGRTNQAAAYMQGIRDAITKVDPKFDFVASDAGGKSVSTGYVQKATAAINSVMPNIDKIVNLSNQVPRIGVTGVDNLLQKTAIELGNEKVTNFRQAQKLIADEIGVALGAGSVSDMKLQLGFDVTDPTVEPQVFASNMQLVKEFIQNRLAGLQSLRYSSGTIGSGTSGSTSGTTSSGLKYTVTQ